MTKMALAVPTASCQFSQLQLLVERVSLAILAPSEPLQQQHRMETHTHAVK
jgi:hypothetical protein